MDKTLFASNGIHAVVDGQFGSTGKGALAAWLAVQAHRQEVEFPLTITNAGPNSGHTSYCPKTDDKIVLKQLPTFAVIQSILGHSPMVYFSAGAVIDVDILNAEMDRFPEVVVYVHPNAAVVTDEDRAAEHSGTVAAVAGTRSGTGAAIARKVLRDPEAVISHPGHKSRLKRGFVQRRDIGYTAVYNRVFMEVSQGFSLGFHSDRFFPKTTSRECTVMQGIADAQLPPQRVQRVYGSYRTFPIRVGNVDGFSSGEWYEDQHEISWDELPGVEPERTTVTNRVRRIATFSDSQFVESANANGIDFAFINFLNYLPFDERRKFIARLHRIADVRTIIKPIFIGGFGPTVDDIAFL